jgi:hypothetical protein
MDANDDRHRNACARAFQIRYLDPIFDRKGIEQLNHREDRGSFHHKVYSQALEL